MLGRREFLAGTAAAATVSLAAGSSRAGVGSAAIAAAQPASGSSSAASAASPRPTFQLKYAPHFGMFRHHGGDDLGELSFMAEQGFTALEDNGMMGRSVEDQAAIAREMERLGMTMGVFVANPSSIWQNRGFATGDAETLDRFLAECRQAVEVAKRVNAKWMTVVPGLKVDHLESDYQTAHVVEALKRAAATFEPHGLVMVLEPLNPWRDHPGLFLTKIPQAYLICKAVGSPSCKILFDLYHQQIAEGNLIPNIDLAWDEIAYFQIGDNPGRNEPGTGEINYRNVFKHIAGKGYPGVLGMEHGNSRDGKEGELAVIEAYRQADAF